MEEFDDIEYTLSDKNFGGQKIPKIFLAAEIFVRRKIVTAEKCARRNYCLILYYFGGQNCRNINLVPKILSAEIFVR